MIKYFLNILNDLYVNVYKEKYDKAQQELNQVITETKNLEDRAHSAYIQSVEYSTQSSMLEKSIQEKTAELNQISDGIKNAENIIYIV